MKGLPPFIASRRVSFDFFDEQNILLYFCLSYS